MIAGSVFFMCFAIYLHNAAPSVTPGDSGEFITAGATLSLPHAPSYPLYVVLNKAFVSAVPWGTVPYRSNAFSALTSALAVLFMFLLAMKISASISAGVLISVIFGLSRSFFENSVVTEVFSLNTVFVSLILWMLLNKQSFLAVAYVLGIGLGNHHVLVFFVPILIFLSKRHEWLKMALCGLLGFSIYAVLPVRAHKQPPLNWGNPSSMSRLVRTVTRKDYGSFTLALGQAPPRTLRNTWLHLKQFGRHIKHELPWGIALLGFLGLVFGFLKRDSFFMALFVLFILFGPFFYLLGNLPLTAQSEGIMGRFFIAPVLCLVLGLLAWGQIHRRATMVLLCLGVLLVGWKHQAQASSMRQAMLVLDYARAMTRTLPMNSTLFMDGGDDAFYGLATLQYALQHRPDLNLHDRGGLVFKNPYGDDFRGLPKEKKKSRRQIVELHTLQDRPLFYATMDENVLPGVPLNQTGFLYQAQKLSEPAISWPLICLRGLYPLTVTGYRARALAAFFPYMNGIFFRDHDVSLSLRFFRQAEFLGEDVDWLHPNISHAYAFWGYGKLLKGAYGDAEKIYSQWIRFDPNAVQAHLNLGVVLERSGQREAARQHYRSVAAKFPDNADSLYNLGAMAWQDQDWKTAVECFNGVLKRDPKHEEAKRFLKLAEARWR